MISVLKKGFILKAEYWEPLQGNLGDNYMSGL